MEKNGIDIFDILLVLAKRKKFIIITTFLVTVAFIIYSLLAIQYWKSTVSFLPITQDQTSSSLAQSILGGFGTSLLGQDMSGGSANYLNIIKSRTFSEKIIRRFDLINYFQLADPDSLVVMERAIKTLHEKLLSTNYDLESGMMTVTIETRERFLSPQIANAYYELLEDYYLTTKMTKGRERRIFLEKQIADFEANFAELSRKMEYFQRDHSVIDLQKQLEAIIGIYSDIVAQKMETEIELDFSRRYMAEDSPIVISLSEKLATLNNTISEMENSSSEIVPKYIVNIDDIPALSNQFVQLSLNLEIQKKVIEFLYPQYEQAKLDELNDVSSFELIDSAVPAGLRSKPRRARMVITAFIISMLVSSIFAYAYNNLTETSRKEKVDSLFKELFKK